MARWSVTVTDAASAAAAVRGLLDDELPAVAAGLDDHTLEALMHALGEEMGRRVMGDRPGPPCQQTGGPT